MKDHILSTKISYNLFKKDENLIMIGGIAGEEVRKFGQNLKSFSEWKGEVNRVLKG